MADKTKRKSITSIDDLTEVIDFLYTIYKSIITNKLPKVHRKVYRSKIYILQKTDVEHRLNSLSAIEIFKSIQKYEVRRSKSFI